MRLPIRLLAVVAAVAAGPSLNADFYCKAPELDPGAPQPGYDIFLPPWYPSNLDEAEQYTVDADGRLVKRPEEDHGLLEYGTKKSAGTAGVPPLTDLVAVAVRRMQEALVYDRVLGAPDAVVRDFYGHVGGVLGGQTIKHDKVSVMVPETMGTGYPPVPADRMVLYDSWVVALQSGWTYKPFSVADGPVLPSSWKGPLVANLREFAVWFTAEGEGTARACLSLLERNRRQHSFVPELEVLRALSGQDHGFTVVSWKQEYLDKLLNGKVSPVPMDTTTWIDAVRTLMLRDLTDERAPRRGAFARIRDAPELAEPLFLELAGKKDTPLLARRNLAVLLQDFESPRAGLALHRLAADKDPVTAIRALNSLSRHPHGDPMKIAMSWCDPKIDDLRRARGILTLGESRSREAATFLMGFHEKAADDFERELVLRSLLRLRHAESFPLFSKASRSRFAPLAWTGRLGAAILKDGEKATEKKALKLIKDAFFREEAKPGSGKAVSFSQFHRFDMVSWMARSKSAKVRRRLWDFITGFKNHGPHLEINGTPHLIAHALYEIELTDKVIGKKKALPILEKMAVDGDGDILVRTAALARLGSLDRNRGLKVAIALVDPVLQGKITPDPVPSRATGAYYEDLIDAAVRTVQVIKPEDSTISRKILMSARLSGRVKLGALKRLYRQDRREALKVVRASLKYYGHKKKLSETDRSYLMKIIRLAGVYKDREVLDTLAGWMVDGADPWVRFMCLYAVRLGLESEAHVDVFVEDAGVRKRQARPLIELISKLDK